MLAPLAGVLRVTQLYGSLVGGPGEAYSVVHGGVTYQCCGHAGIDFAAALGSPVFAMKGGLLTHTPYDPWAGEYGAALGLYCCITLPGGEMHRYAHLSQLAILSNTVVQGGEIIAYSGNTGASTGPHLHASVLPAHPDYANHFDGTIEFLAHFDHTTVLDLSQV